MDLAGNAGLRSIFQRVWFSPESPISGRLKQFIATVVPGPLLVATKKRYYTALVKNPKTPREADMDALNQVIRPGDFALDIGAFVGFYTQRLSQLVGATGEVWAFEPVPETFSVLSYVVRELSLHNVRVLNLALSDSDGQAVMRIPRYRHGGECLYDASMASLQSRSPLRKITVQKRSLDSVLSSGRAVRFMKLDVEFHELSVVCGALETIRRDHPMILTEWISLVSIPDSRPTVQNVLTREGYKSFRYADGEFVPCTCNENSQNRFFLTESHVAEFAQYVRWN